jgi:glutathione S-transferase
MDMILYGGLLSPYVMRAALVAKHKGLDLPVKQPEGGLKTPEFLKLNPIGKMPTLVDGDFVLPESDVIAQYLDEAFPQKPVLPADPKQRAKVRLISRLVDVYMAPNLGPLFQSMKGEAADNAIAGMTKALDYIEHFLEGDPYAVCNQFSLADCALIPFFFFLDVFDASYNTSALIAARPRLAAWWAKAKTSEEGAWAIQQQGVALQAFMKMRSAQG